MGLFQKTNGSSSVLESTVEDDIIRIIGETRFWMTYDRVYPTTHQQFRVPEVNRRSDIVVVFNKRKVVNIEVKMRDVGGVIRQAKDHMQWADYSYIAMPHDAYITSTDIHHMLRLGIGFLMWHPDGVIMEVLKGYKSEVKNKKFRTQIMRRLWSLHEKAQSNVANSMG